MQRNWRMFNLFISYRLYLWCALFESDLIPSKRVWRSSSAGVFQWGNTDHGGHGSGHQYCKTERSRGCYGKRELQLTIMRVQIETTNLKHKTQLHWKELLPYWFQWMWNTQIRLFYRNDENPLLSGHNLNSMLIISVILNLDPFRIPVYYIIIIRLIICTHLCWTPP